MQKNVAGQKWIVFAFDRTTNAPKTGDAANITANLYIDGVLNAVDDTNPTELSGGYYVFDITAAESNGNLIVISPSSVTANIQVIGVPGSYSTSAVWDESLSSHLAAGSTGAKLNALDAIGAGEISWTYTLTDAATGLPIMDAHVWVTSDLAGTTILASGYTNSSGVVTFHMVSGATVYVWRQKDGYSFTNPDLELIS